MGRPYEINKVDQQLAERWSEIMNIEAEATKAPMDLIKTPEPFKKDTKWRPWKESFTTYLIPRMGKRLYHWYTSYMNMTYHCQMYFIPPYTTKW
jgi:hypothetical protein